jgi:CRP-like cAMP-binding protein
MVSFGFQGGGNRLLSSLPLEDMALLSSGLKQASFVRGEVLQEVGDLIEQVYFPQNGMVSLLAAVEADAFVEVATVGREGAIGVIAGFVNSKATCRAVVQLDAELVTIATATFQNAIGASPGLRDLIARYAEAQTRLVYQVVGCNAFHSATARLGRWLLQTRDRSERDGLLLTQDFLSRMLGVRRATVTVAAQELQTLGLIRYRQGRIEIVDRVGLEHAACGCYQSAKRTIEEVYQIDRRGPPADGG